jgi:iron complex transport system ATP-binding protein
MRDFLQMQHVSGGYFKEDIVRDVSLAVAKGDFLGLIGPNGSGKTTLLRLVTRALSLRAGKVIFRGKDIFTMQLKELCREVAFVGQDVATAFPYTVMEYVLMGRIPHLKRLQFETKKDLAIAEKALQETGTLSLQKKRINELSAGERQRVIIAQALTQEPQLLFLDEPTSHLDIGHQIQVLDLLKRLNRRDALTIVMVLHDLNLASAYTNRLALLDQGKIYKEGTPAEVLTYQNIEAVYKTVVLVHENPVTHKPNVLLVPGEK